jgi:hypothetical protein
MMRRAVVIAALSVMHVGGALAVEPGRGFPFRGGNIECVVVDNPPRHAKGDHRWFVTALTRYPGREDGCRVAGITRYGQALAWGVSLSCPGGSMREDWTLNYDGSVTADRAGTKTNYRVCSRQDRR